ncbi:MAG: carbonic anhydrase [Chloroflexi bacterium]|nr:carbonic anhydrase [Chloroflexota bacterium]
MKTSLNSNRRQFLALSGIAIAGATLGAAAPATAAAPAAAEKPVTNADEALKRLMEGNVRFVSDKTIDPNQTTARRTELAKGQKPFATILSCVDSRVPPEIVFDRGLGDLFVIRTAGQVIDKAVLGSIEFGAAELGIPLIVVMGHEKCGAVKATIETLEKGAKAPGAIEYLVEGIAPAVEAVKGKSGDMLDNAVQANVDISVATLKKSTILAGLLKAGKIKIVGARYDLDSGKVELHSHAE